MANFYDLLERTAPLRKKSAIGFLIAFADSGIPEIGACRDPSELEPFYTEEAGMGRPPVFAPLETNPMDYGRKRGGKRNFL